VSHGLVVQIEKVVPNLSPSTETNAARFQSAQTVGGDFLSVSEARRIRDKKRLAAHYIANREKVIARAAKWHAENPEKSKRIKSNWNARNPEKRKASREKWASSNPLNQKSRADKYRATHKDEVKARNAKWHFENPEKAKAGKAAYRAANPEKMREQFHRYRARKLSATTATNSELLSIVTWQTRIRKLRLAACYWCAVEFDPRPKGSWHMDHVIALSRGGSHSAVNLCISCPACNLRKNAKPLAEWSASLPQPMLPI
jgi:5-methylcytosine-specific restriction endonuclease McrA